MAWSSPPPTNRAPAGQKGREDITGRCNLAGQCFWKLQVARYGQKEDEVRGSGGDKESMEAADGS